MTKKYTPEEIDVLDKAVGAIPIGKYINSHTPREYCCVKCGESFFTTSNTLRHYKQTMCRRCGNKIGTLKRRKNVDYVKQVCREQGFEPLFNDNDYINSSSKLKMRCRCGRICKLEYTHIQSRNTKSCGHCDDPNIGDKFHSLTIIKVVPAKGKGCRIDCVCDCGTLITNINSAQITSNTTKSCGNCNDPKIGDIFGQLTPIIIFPLKRGRGCQVVCECECGRDTQILDGCHLTNHSNTSCGNCMLRRHGKTTSNISLQLQSIIEQITQQKWEHNYHIKGVGCVDIVHPNLKIAIEYDSYYWHRVHTNWEQRDKNKYKKLISLGWKVLNIKSNGNDLPTEPQLRNILLNDFQHGAQKRTITMNSWKDAERKYNQ